MSFDFLSDQNFWIGAVLLVVAYVAIQKLRDRPFVPPKLKGIFGGGGGGDQKRR